MTTINDLRAALTQDADRASTPTRVAQVRHRLRAGTTRHTGGPSAGPELAVPERAVRRSRQGWAALAATAALVVIVTSVFRLGGGLPSNVTTVSTVPSTVMPVSNYQFAVSADPGGLTFQDAGTAAGVQGGFWRKGSGRSAQAVLNVGVSLPAIGQVQRPPDATDVTIDSHPGWRAPHQPTQDLYYNLDRNAELTVWQDATGLWVVLLTIDMTPARIAQLAHTVHPGRTRPVTFPAHLEYLPPDAHLTATSCGPGPYADLEFGPHGALFTLGINRAGRSFAGSTGTAPPQELSINGFTGTYRPDDPTTILTNGHIDVTINYAKTAHQAMPLEQLTRLVQGLTPAGALTNPSTWPTLDTALPTPH